VIELVKVPVPVPSDVLVDRAIVGPVEVFQTTPRADTASPPSADTVPPLLAVVEVIAEIAVVALTVGITSVVKVSSEPYEVPTALVA
jgi:hypothetical protein